ncbi:Outer membrane protein assembly factor BamB, contains PQQ-like beta-propeller repeat [Halogranum gelatinilyticum]|uniref:Outer membrane protein assembly factor BamB, contains PQQ-like beta-propeller repeat n=1 Tax=Halogranum gelatinilyticum TaxID=660521 RepID=A0A1G9RI95_9EURY|nr:PQQ-binding-like beta-propeller repeat protein [Halogranum gelatinilyticum]SDM22966.1 Outer membrane protein assembly factor BamB, contains PQQ-like beta-propeller repeat [Halogranum gelatinilyticum]
MTGPYGRRRYLQLAAAALSTAVGGCLDGSEQSTPTDRPTTATAETTTEPTAAEPSVEGAAIRWRVPLAKRVSTPATDGDSVYTTSSDRTVRAFAAADGSRRWETSHPTALYRGPRVSDDAVYVCGYDRLSALDPRDGSERWHYELAGSFSSNPVFGDGRLYVGNSSVSTSHRASQYPEDLFALDPDDGSLVWKRDLAEEDRLAGRPLLHDGTLYVQLERGGLVALDPDTGETRWRTTLSSQRQQAKDGPKLAGRTLVATDADLVYGLDPENGSERWQVGDVATVPATLGDTVYVGGYVGTKRMVYALAAADGSERWRQTVDGEFSTISALSTGTTGLYVSTTRSAGDRGGRDDETTLHALGDGGSLRWRLTVSCAGVRPVAVHDETTFVGTGLGDGSLYALTAD